MHLLYNIADFPHQLKLWLTRVMPDTSFFGANHLSANGCNSKRFLFAQIETISKMNNYAATIERGYLPLGLLNISKKPVFHIAVSTATKLRTYSGIKKEVLIRLLKQCAGIISLSKYQQEYFEEAGLAANYIPMGTDKNFFKPPKERGSYLLAPGNEARDYTNLVKYITKLNIRSNFMTTIPLPKSNLIEINWSTSMLELRNQYSKGSFAVIPINSGKETQDNPGQTCALDCMAMGLPVIMTRTKAAEDIIDSYKNGILVERNDKELYNAIVYLNENPSEIKKMGANARRLIEEKLNTNTFANKLLDYIKSSVGV